MTTIVRSPTKPQNQNLLDTDTSSGRRPRRQCVRSTYNFDSDTEFDERSITRKKRPVKLTTRSKTPPKQHQKTQKSPTTPGNRKTDEKLARTASVLLEKLQLNSPTGKRSSNKNENKTESSPPKLRRISHTNTNRSRKELFNNGLSDEIKENRKNHVVEDLNGISPFTSDDLVKENHENLLKLKTDIYVNARKALHSTYPIEMPGRERELEILRDFIRTHLDARTSGSLYVSGPPGTGKTASLNLILEQDRIATQLKHIYVNCTSIKSSNSIFSKISKELSLKIVGKSEKDHCSGIEEYLIKNHKTILLVLDEIDQLESKNQSVLYTIFEWPSRYNSKLILIGIANALDLTDRILPRLQAHCELKPNLLHFPPYTKQQIIEIFTKRLKTAGVLEIFTPQALQMLASKVAAISGDVRRALDIGRRVVELIDNKQHDNNTVLKSLENLTQNDLEKVDLRQVVEVLNNIYNTSQNFTNDVDDAFPLQQKLIICTLLLILKKSKNKDITIGRLHDVYRRICNKRNIQIIDQSEFSNICILIETRGMIKIIRKKDPRLNKINLQWNEDEINRILKDKQLMADILQDDTCLGRV